MLIEDRMKTGLTVSPHLSNRLCVSMPPKWSRDTFKEFGELVETTVNGERLVAEDTESCLYVITPFIDPGTLQTTLQNVYYKNKHLILITSERKLVQSDPRARKYFRNKLKDVIKRRFGGGKIYYFEESSMIAHAKVWSSEKSVFITSANIKPNSSTDNLEMGVYSEDPELIRVVRMFIENILEKKELRCVVKID